MTYNFEIVGKRLLALRKEKHYSLAYVAERCEIQQYQTVSNWEKGNAKPSLECLMKLCELYDCELGYLLGEYDCKTHEFTDIHSCIGLSEKAISHLKELNTLSYADNKTASKYCRQWIDLFSAFAEDTFLQGTINDIISRLYEIKNSHLLNDDEISVFGNEKLSEDFYSYALSRYIISFIEKFVKDYTNKNGGTNNGKHQKD